MKPLVFHKLVQNDINAILRYYEVEGGKQLADRFFSEFEILLDDIAREPGRYHAIDYGFRRANMRSFPYHLLYRVHSSEVHVFVLRHHRRHPQLGKQRKLG